MVSSGHRHRHDRKNSISASKEHHKNLTSRASLVEGSMALTERPTLCTVAAPPLKSAFSMSS